LIVAFDTSILILLFDKKARAPKDPKNGLPVADCQPRIEFLVSTLSRIKGAQIIVPTPTLAELFVYITPEAASTYLAMLGRIRGFKISPFSVRAAIEFAEIQREILNSQKLRPEERARLSKPKFDHQIVAVAKVEGASIIYSDDERLGKFAKRLGIKTVGVAELPLPPAEAQASLPFEPPESTLPSDEP
jgi:predicted nucleic acid-binding protein